MRLPVSEHKLETNIDSAVEVVIGQEESSKILTFLRDNIYENPKQALVKELVSNALDVHIENNVIRPIEITTPTTFNNLLIIRDFGTGLSPEFMSTKYTQVGLSTKNDNDSTLGGWGIGRLSPLAYTDVYYIDSYFEGTLYKYMLTVYDENYKKKVSLLNISEFDTDEPSGLKVSIPIKEEDYSIIENIVREHCRFLYNQPPLINNKPADLAPKLVEGNGWFVTHCFNDYIVGLIGGIPTKIKNISEYTTCHYNENYAYNRLGLVIEIPIGSVTQTASKDIQNSKLTETTLTKLFNKAKKELIPGYQNKLNSIDNLVEAIQLVGSLNYDWINGLKWKHIEFNRYYGVSLNNCNIRTVKLSRRGKSVKYYFDYTSKIPITSCLKVFINDLETENQSLLTQKICEKYPSAYIISNITQKNFNDIYNFPLVSSIISKDKLVEPPKVKKQPVTKKKVDTSCVTAYELRSETNLQTYCSTNKVRVPKDPDSTKYYIRLIEENKKLVCNNVYYNLQTQYTSIYLFENINKLNLDKWVDFKVYLKEKVESLLEKTPKLLEVVDLLENYNGLWNILECFKEVNASDLKDLYNKVCQLQIFYHRLSAEEANLVLLETYNQTKLSEVKLENSLLAEYRKIEAKYTLIFKHYARQNELYNKYGYKYKNTELTLEEINQYIQLVNK